MGHVALDLLQRFAEGLRPLCKPQASGNRFQASGKVRRNPMLYVLTASFLQALSICKLL
jgi:hypothetical protein